MNVIKCATSLKYLREFVGSSISIHNTSPLYDLLIVCLNIVDFRARVTNAAKSMNLIFTAEQVN